MRTKPSKNTFTISKASRLCPQQKVDPLLPVAKMVSPQAEAKKKKIQGSAQFLSALSKCYSTETWRASKI